MEVLKKFQRPLKSFHNDPVGAFLSQNRKFNRLYCNLYARFSGSKGLRALREEIDSRKRAGSNWPLVTEGLNGSLNKICEDSVSSGLKKLSQKAL